VRPMYHARWLWLVPGSPNMSFWYENYLKLQIITDFQLSPGNVNSSADGSCSTTQGSWHFSAKDCCENNHTSCSDCTSLPHCGWCNAAPGENATCFEKAANGLPFNGTCIHKHWELHNDECGTLSHNIAEIWFNSAFLQHFPLFFLSCYVQ